jgi:UDP-N-acetylmuramoyl-tripeptide--D-alanyl-D-alanine ligase
VRLSAAMIAEIVDARVVGDRAAVADRYVNDSRRAGVGDCFIALRDQRDGHAYVEDALGRGATIAIVESDPLPGPPAAGVGLVVTTDSATALLRLATAVRSRLAPSQVVGITGSVGKTSTKDLIVGALASSLTVHASAASFNNEVGLPITVLDAPVGVEVLVTEMGARLPETSLAWRRWHNRPWES